VLGHLASGNDASRADVVAAGALPPLVWLLSSGSDSGKAEVAEVLGILSGNNANNAAIVAAGALPPLVKLLSGVSDEGNCRPAARRWCHGGGGVGCDSAVQLLEPRRGAASNGGTWLHRKLAERAAGRVQPRVRGEAGIRQLTEEAERRETRLLGPVHLRSE
jgi:hypothetical protein